MHDDQRHRARALRLPVAVAEHLHVRLDANQPLFRRRQFVAARQEVARDGLRVSADEGTARLERLAEVIVRARGFGRAQGVRNGGHLLAHGTVAGSSGFVWLHL